MLPPRVVTIGVMLGMGCGSAASALGPPRAQKNSNESARSYHPSGKLPLETPLATTYGLETL